MTELAQINILQIEHLLGPSLRNVQDCSRYINEDLQSGNIAGVQLWQNRLLMAVQSLNEKSNEILAKQQMDAKLAEDDARMDQARNQCGVTS